jgi:LuxR family transcriptional regulator, quorum-sensing system regulator CinR
MPEVTTEVDEKLSAAFALIDSAVDIEEMVQGVRDLLGIDHLVYHSSKLGASPSADPYIRLTYPASWIKQYLQMNYVDVDPVLREGFLRTLPFDWSELEIKTKREMEFLEDALAHGVGPFGMSIPVRSKRGHRGLVSLSSSGPQEKWIAFCKENLSIMIEVANRLHRRVIKDVFGEDQPHLTERELECLRWVAQGKDAGAIATILDISPHTARDYLKSARFKLDCVSSAQAVSKAVKMGLLSL